MPTTLQFRRYTTAELASITGAVGELIIDTDKDIITVHDGSTAGGFELQSELVSGTNIKTVNGTSLLGSGDVTVQDELVSGTNIKTVNGTSLLGSGDVTVGADFSAVAEDIIPTFSDVYDIGSTEKRWYDVFVSNSVDINGSAITAADGVISTTADMAVGSLLVDNLLFSDNLITPDTSTVRQYSGDAGWVVINGNLDVDGELLQLPVVETTTTTSTSTGIQPGETSVFTFDSYQINVFNNAYGFDGVRLYGTTNFESMPPTLVDGAVISFAFDGYSFEATITDSTQITTDGSAFLIQIPATALNKTAWEVQYEIYENNDATAVNVVGPDQEVTITTSTDFPPSTTGLEGTIRFNKDEGAFEGYDGTAWGSLGGGGIAADENGNALIDANLIVTGDIISLSDINAKENITKVESALNIVSAIDGVYYNLKEDPEKRHVGVIAQNIEEVLPEVVYESNGVKSVAYGNIVGVLIEAIKELKAEIEELKNGV